jgi:hypothetical protein
VSYPGSLLLALIHLSGWKGFSPKFATSKQPQATVNIRRLGDVPERTSLLPCFA